MSDLDLTNPMIKEAGEREVEEMAEKLWRAIDPALLSNSKWEKELPSFKDSWRRLAKLVLSVLSSTRKEARAEGFEMAKVKAVAEADYYSKNSQTARQITNAIEAIKEDIR